ncbi:unnamed protein product [Lymnaea stagnalis]|uniref:Uncharacterized protein n=1 Tax=Lymnaea stagnalis TaxID=6523 RepID=A0AAV2HI13_LYMST
MGKNKSSKRPEETSKDERKENKNKDTQKQKKSKDDSKSLRKNRAEEKSKEVSYMIKYNLKAGEKSSTPKQTNGAKSPLQINVFQPRQTFKVTKIPHETKARVTFPEVKDTKLAHETKARVTFPEVKDTKLAHETKARVIFPEVKYTKLAHETKARVTFPEVKDTKLAHETKARVTFQEVKDIKLAHETKARVTFPEVKDTKLAHEMKARVTFPEVKDTKLAHETKAKVTFRETPNRKFAHETKAKNSTKESKVANESFNINEGTQGFSVSRRCKRNKTAALKRQNESKGSGVDNESPKAGDSHNHEQVTIVDLMRDTVKSKQAGDKARVKTSVDIENGKHPIQNGKNPPKKGKHPIATVQEDPQPIPGRPRNGKALSNAHKLEKYPLPVEKFYKSISPEEIRTKRKANAKGGEEEAKPFVEFRVTRPTSTLKVLITSTDNIAEHDHAGTGVGELLRENLTGKSKRALKKERLKFNRRARTSTGAKVQKLYLNPGSLLSTTKQTNGTSARSVGSKSDASVIGAFKTDSLDGGNPARLSSDDGTREPDKVDQGESKKVFSKCRKSNKNKTKESKFKGSPVSRKTLEVETVQRESLKPEQGLSNVEKSKQCLSTEKSETSLSHKKSKQGLSIEKSESSLSDTEKSETSLSDKKSKKGLSDAEKSKQGLPTEKSETSLSHKKSKRGLSDTDKSKQGLSIEKSETSLSDTEKYETCLPDKKPKQDLSDADKSKRGLSDADKSKQGLSDIDKSKQGPSYAEKSKERTLNGVKSKSNISGAEISNPRASYKVISHKIPPVDEMSNASTSNGDVSEPSLPDCHICTPCHLCHFKLKPSFNVHSIQTKNSRHKQYWFFHKRRILKQGHCQSTCAKWYIEFCIPVESTLLSKSFTPDEWQDYLTDRCKVTPSKKSQLRKKAHEAHLRNFEWEH